MGKKIIPSDYKSNFKCKVLYTHFKKLALIYLLTCEKIDQYLDKSRF